MQITKGKFQKWYYIAVDDEEGEEESKELRFQVGSYLPSEPLTLYWTVPELIFLCVLLNIIFLCVLLNPWILVEEFFLFLQVTSVALLGVEVHRAGVLSLA